MTIAASTIDIVRLHDFIVNCHSKEHKLPGLRKRGRMSNRLLKKKHYSNYTCVYGKLTVHFARDVVQADFPDDINTSGSDESTHCYLATNAMLAAVERYNCIACMLIPGNEFSELNNFCVFCEGKEHATLVNMLDSLRKVASDIAAYPFIDSVSMDIYDAYRVDSKDEELEYITLEYLGNAEA